MWVADAMGRVDIFTVLLLLLLLLFLISVNEEWGVSHVLVR